MGLMDGFTSDGTVEMKHTEYYNLMREAAKAELIGNAVKAEVPGFYIQAMITGKIEMPDYMAETTVEVQTEETTEEWGAITTAVKGVLDEWSSEAQVADMAKHIHAVVTEMTDARIKELRLRQLEKWAAENENTPKECWSCRTCGNTKPLRMDVDMCKACQDGSNYTPADDMDEKSHEMDAESEETDNGND